jgi:hypothetical protein
MQKWLNKLREDFNKHQSETNETIKEETYEIKKTQEMKEHKDVESLRKKKQTEILDIKSPFSQTKKHSGRPLHHTRTSGR